jgi:RNA polymerase sigma-70 factor (ECF subfamily)
VFDDDLKLARSLLQGNERGFRTFFDRYAPLLLGFVLRRSGLDRAAAEDVVQNTMIRAVRALPGYRGEASLFTWLCQVCRSELADQHRAATRRPATVSFDQDPAAAAVVAAAVTSPVASSSYPDVVDPGQYDDRVLEVLATLTAPHAGILEMKYASELPVSEIAARLRITPTAAQSLLARAREAFRERWLEGGGDRP